MIQVFEYIPISFIAAVSAALLAAVLWNLRAHHLPGFSSPKPSFFIGNLPSLRRYCYYPFLSELHWAAQSQYGRFSLTFPLGAQAAVLFHPQDIRTVLQEQAVVIANATSTTGAANLSLAAPVALGPAVVRAGAEVQGMRGPTEAASPEALPNPTTTQRIAITDMPEKGSSQPSSPRVRVATHPNLSPPAEESPSPAQSRWMSENTQRVDRALQRASPLWPPTMHAFPHVPPRVLSSAAKHTRAHATAALRLHIAVDSSDAMSQTALGASGPRVVAGELGSVTHHLRDSANSCVDSTPGTEASASLVHEHKPTPGLPSSINAQHTAVHPQDKGALSGLATGGTENALEHEVAAEAVSPPRAVAAKERHGERHLRWLNVSPERTSGEHSPSRYAARVRADVVPRYAATPQPLRQRSSRMPTGSALLPPIGQNAPRGLTRALSLGDMTAARHGTDEVATGGSMRERGSVAHQPRARVRALTRLKHAFPPHPLLTASPRPEDHLPYVSQLTVVSPSSSSSSASSPSSASTPTPSRASPLFPVGTRSYTPKGLNSASVGLHPFTGDEGVFSWKDMGSVDANLARNACVDDGYEYDGGVSPRLRRRKRTDTWGGHSVDNNHIYRSGRRDASPRGMGAWPAGEGEGEMKVAADDLTVGWKADERRATRAAGSRHGDWDNDADSTLFQHAGPHIHSNSHNDVPGHQPINPNLPTLHLSSASSSSSSVHAQGVYSSQAHTDISGIVDLQAVCRDLSFHFFAHLIAAHAAALVEKSSRNHPGGGSSDGHGDHQRDSYWRSPPAPVPGLPAASPAQLPLSPAIHATLASPCLMQRAQVAAQAFALRTRVRAMTPSLLLEVQERLHTESEQMAYKSATAVRVFVSSLWPRVLSQGDAENSPLIERGVDAGLLASTQSLHSLFLCHMSPVAARMAAHTLLYLATLPPAKYALQRLRPAVLAEKRGQDQLPCGQAIQRPFDACLTACMLEALRLGPCLPLAMQAQAPVVLARNTSNVSGQAPSTRSASIIPQGCYAYVSLSALGRHPDVSEAARYLPDRWLQDGALWAFDKTGMRRVDAVEASVEAAMNSQTGPGYPYQSSAETSIHMVNNKTASGSGEGHVSEGVDVGDVVARARAAAIRAERRLLCMWLDMVGITLVPPASTHTPTDNNVDESAQDDEIDSCDRTEDDTEARDTSLMAVHLDDLEFPHVTALKDTNIRMSNSADVEELATIASISHTSPTCEGCLPPRAWAQGDEPVSVDTTRTGAHPVNITDVPTMNETATTRIATRPLKTVTLEAGAVPTATPLVKSHDLPWERERHHGRRALQVVLACAKAIVLSLLDYDMCPSGIPTHEAVDLVLPTAPVGSASTRQTRSFCGCGCGCMVDDSSCGCAQQRRKCGANTLQPRAPSSASCQVPELNLATPTTINNAMHLERVSTLAALRSLAGEEMDVGNLDDANEHVWVGDALFTQGNEAISSPNGVMRGDVVDNPRTRGNWRGSKGGTWWSGLDTEEGVWVAIASVCASSDAKP